MLKRIAILITLLVAAWFTSTWAIPKYQHARQVRLEQVLNSADASDGKAAARRRQFASGRAAKRAAAAEVAAARPVELRTPPAINADALPEELRGRCLRARERIVEAQERVRKAWELQVRVKKNSMTLLHGEEDPEALLRGFNEELAWLGQHCKA